MMMSCRLFADEIDSRKRPLLLHSSCCRDTVVVGTAAARIVVVAPVLTGYTVYCFEKETQSKRNQ
jgi:hypothetical protein